MPRLLNCVSMLVFLLVAATAVQGADHRPAAADPTADDDTAAAMQGAADDAVRRAVLGKLRTDPHVDVADLDVTVQNGTITLYGRVATAAEKHLASRYANDIRGARGVVNGIDVVPGLRETVAPRAQPQAITDQVGREGD